MKSAEEFSLRKWHSFFPFLPESPSDYSSQGLGKTLEVLALVINRPRAAARVAKPRRSQQGKRLREEDDVEILLPVRAKKEPPAKKAREQRAAKPTKTFTDESDPTHSLL